MKRTFIDKMVGFFSPEAELSRLRGKVKTELIMRTYDAAQTFATDDWTSATQGGANSEIGPAQSVLRSKGRDAIRNNPFAGRALAAIVSNTVGSGIMPQIKADTEEKVQQLEDAWKEWAETTLCDSNGKLNFYSMQALALRSTVESGEALVLKENTKDGPKLKLIESDFIDSSKDVAPDSSGVGIVQGIKINKSGTPVSYLLYPTHPGDTTPSGSNEYPAAKLCHVYRQDRPGQLRGVSWFHPVIRQLEDFNQFQQATLVSRKIAACFAVFVTAGTTDSALSDEYVKTKRERDSMLSPGSIKYLDNGEDVKLATPPAISGYDEYCRQTLRAIASGLGITYEAVTSDYSQVNYSSGKMGHNEFKKNCDVWRWNMLIPQFCDPAFEHFKLWCYLKKGINPEGISCEWVPPAWQMIDPVKEIAAINDAIRTGLTTLPKAIKEQGYNPKDHLKEIAEFNSQLDAQGILLDSDPRKLTKAGILQISNVDMSKGKTQSE